CPMPRLPLALLAAALLAAAPRAQTVIHVDADAPPGGDGASWATAFHDLRDALAAASTHRAATSASGRHVPLERGSVAGGAPFAARVRSELPRLEVQFGRGSERERPLLVYRAL